MYADINFYKEEYLGEDPQDDVLLNKLLSRASDDVDYYAPELEVSELSAKDLELLKKATCAQAEFYVLNGEEYNNSDTDSATIGKFSYGGAKAQKTSNNDMCPRALKYLTHTGLLYRGVENIDSSYTYREEPYV